MSDPDRPSPDEKAAFRAFVREHHPDRGGDPAVFAAGMDRFRAGSEADSPAEPTDEPRDGDGSTAPYGPLPFPVRLGVALIRTWRRRHEHRVDDQ